MRKYLGVLCALTIVGLGSACEVEEDTGSGSSATQQEDTTPAGDTKKKAKKEADNSSKGKGPLTWGNWEVVGKLQVSKDVLDQYQVVTRVKNTGDEVDEGIFTVTILKGTEILGTADCSTSSVDPGAIGTADCVSMDAFKPGWTEITIENSF